MRLRYLVVGINAAQGVGDGSPPMGSTGRAPEGGLGTRLPEAEAVCRHCLQILTAETFKI